MIDEKSFQLYLMVFAVIQLITFLGLGFAVVIPLFMIVIIFVIFLRVEMDKRRFPVNVIVLVKRKGGFSIVFDKATRMVDKATKKEYYRLKGAKKDIKPSDFGNVIESRKGLFNLLYAPTSEEYTPITSISDGKLKVMDEDMKMWYAQSVKKAYERFQQKSEWWDRYGGIVGLAVLGILMAIILYANSQYMTGVTAQMSSAASTLADAVRGFSSAVSGSGGITPPH